MALDERVWKDLNHHYKKMNADGRLLSGERLSSYYESFERRFGPDRLEVLKGEELLEALHNHANHASLAYWLEFKSDDEFDTTKLGSIRGGSALKFGVYRGSQNGPWMGKGPGGKPVEISPDRAIEVAERHRAQLLRGCELLEDLPEEATDAEYEKLQEGMDADAPDVARLAWGHKYFSLLYPDKLDDYHSPTYQRYHLVKILQVPPKGDGRYIAAGQYMRTARDLSVPVANLTQILNERDGEPHRYWRVTVNYPNLGREWINWPAMRDGDFAAIGWANLGDLSDVVGDKGGIKERLRSLMKANYNAPGRWTSEVFDFVAGMSTGDLVLAVEVSKVLGVGEVQGLYHFDDSLSAPHRRPVRWLSSAEWQLSQEEGKDSAVREIKDYENQVAAERMVLYEPSKVNGGADAVRKPLNTVLYGPPGTGKTYSVQRRALEIVDPGFVAERPAPTEVGERFREYVAQGRIEFVTFHQSYSYEEFVEGFRYDPDEKVPTLHKGIFQTLVENAANPHQDLAPVEGAKIWKVSLGGSTEPHIFERCMKNDEIAVGWLQGVDLTDSDASAIASLFEAHHPGKSTKSVDYLVNGMREGDYVAIFGSVRTIRAIGVVTGEYAYKGDRYDEYHHVRPVTWLDRREHDIVQLNDNKKLTLQTIYELQSVPLQEFVRFLPRSKVSEEPYVLIIDEINRGNISRIFGELITLLEPDKRRGAPNEISLRLPYSGRAFTVPPNLHVIGTMNTADRSIARVDVAAGGRFEFEEMAPETGVVRKVLTEKAKDHPEGLSEEQVELVCAVFERVNARIEASLDRDHRLGHGYFLDAHSMDRLHEALYRKVFPLLQEYFYNDRERLERLLGVYSSTDGKGFVKQLKVEYGPDFGAEEGDELPWEFHAYGIHELEGVLRKTFVGT